MHIFRNPKVSDCVSIDPEKCPFVQKIDSERADQIWSADFWPSCASFFGQCSLQDKAKEFTVTSLGELILLLHTPSSLRKKKPALNPQCPTKLIRCFGWMILNVITCKALKTKRHTIFKTSEGYGTSSTFANQKYLSPTQARQIFLYFQF